ncbi:MAG: DNA ligase [Proteobacteria bacterium]|nr:DNA ligase [Pseudomonadota bacterium]
MSKMGELDLCVSELRSVAQSLNTVADSLTSLFSGSQPETSVQPTSKPLTLEEVRAVLAEKSRNGHTAKIRELLEKHGAAKLSEIDPQKYAALLAEAEVLGNG